MESGRLMQAEKTTVQLVKRGDEHPYVIEITTPGWRGVDEARKGTPIATSMPYDLWKINNILNEAGVKRWKGTDGSGKTKMLFMDDGTTEIVLEDATDFELAIQVLTRAGWLVPETPSTIQ